jgi:large repetitive protein
LLSVAIAIALASIGCGKTDTTIAVTGVSLDKSAAAVLISGARLLTATIEPTDATNRSLKWSTSDPAKATVSQGGLVAGAGLGTATITVETEDGGYIKTCEVDVTAFSRVTGSADPFGGVDVTGGAGISTAALADIDADGDLEALLGESYGTIAFFEY